MSWEDAPMEASNNRRNASRSQIFGNYEESDKKIKADEKQATEKAKDLEIAQCDEMKSQSDCDRNKQLNQRSMVNEGFGDLSKIPHQIRYSSMLDENISNTNKIREQQLEQKQWLDQQIADKKLLNCKNKTSDKLFDESVLKREAMTSTHHDRQKIEKHDMQNQIRDYNQAMAKQKRDDEKKLKDMDKQEANGTYQKASMEEIKEEKAQRQRQQDEMVDKERAMSRDMRQMNTNN